MVKLRGFGGETEFWDHCLDSFTLMAGIAAVTQRIMLYASTAVLTLPPAIAARMASTIDSIAPGRFGINIVSGWAAAEYSQMGLWPGNEHFEHRYKYSAEYVTVMRELWATGTSDHKGSYFQMTDCKLSPRPSVTPKIVSAGQSDVGMAFTAEHADFGFCLGEGVNTPTKCASTIGRLVKAVAEDRPERRRLRAVHGDRGRNRTKPPQAKWESYKAAKDLDALSWLGEQANADDRADAGGTALSISNPVSAVTSTWEPWSGRMRRSRVCSMNWDTIEGLAGVMLTFDDFIIGLEISGQRIQPLMATRSSVAIAA